MILGLVVGAIIRYGFKTNNTIQRLPVVPADRYNQSIPPDILWFRVPDNNIGANKTFAYSFRGEIFKQDSEIDKKVRNFLNNHKYFLWLCGFYFHPCYLYKMAYLKTKQMNYF